MNLQFDVGNTFLKWRLLDAGKIVKCGRELTSSIEYLSLSRAIFWGELEVIAIACVAPVEVEERLFRLCGDLRPDIKPYLAETQSCAAGVTCGYDEPSLMGVDRWLAIVAAYTKYREACCVIDCGSAITVDVVDGEGVHRGGYIIPGIKLMEAGLETGTGRVYFDSGCNSLDVSLGLNTGDCVRHGVNFTVRSLIAAVVDRYVAQGVSRFMVTGGDAKELVSVTPSLEFAPDLVFDGLSELASKYLNK